MKSEYHTLNIQCGRSCPQQYKLNYIDNLVKVQVTFTQSLVRLTRNHPTLFGCDVQCYKETSHGDDLDFC